MTIPELAELAVRLSADMMRSPAGRVYTRAEHAVILSTYVSESAAMPTLMHIAGLALLDSPELERAEARLARDETGIACLPPVQAAFVFASQYQELAGRA